MFKIASLYKIMLLPIGFFCEEIDKTILFLLMFKSIEQNASLMDIFFLLSSLVSSVLNTLIISLLLVLLPGSGHMQNKPTSKVSLWGVRWFSQGTFVFAYFMFDMAQNE